MGRDAGTDGRQQWAPSDLNVLGAEVIVHPRTASKPAHMAFSRKPILEACQDAQEPQSDPMAGCELYVSVLTSAEEEELLLNLEQLVRQGESEAGFGKISETL